MTVPVTDVIGELRAAPAKLRHRAKLYRRQDFAVLNDRANEHVALADALDGGPDSGYQGGLLAEHDGDGVWYCRTCTYDGGPCPTLRLLLPVVRTTLGTETS